MISNRRSQQLSQQRFVVLLLVVEMIVAVMFCIYVRYDDSIKPNSPEGHLANDSSSKPAPLKAHEDTYPCRPFVQCDQIGRFWMFKFPYQSRQNVWWLQCEQIGRKIRLFLLISGKDFKRKNIFTILNKMDAYLPGALYAAVIIVTSSSPVANLVILSMIVNYLECFLQLLPSLM